MWDSLLAAAGQLFGVAGKDLNVPQMALRAVVVYVATILMVRIGQKRFIGQGTAFDFVMGIILGSVVSRAVNGTAPFWPTMAAGAVLVAMHWLFADLTYRSHRLGLLLKGSYRRLVHEGHVDWDAMRASRISEHDLQAAARLHANLAQIEDAAEAYIERTGEISVVHRKREPAVLEVRVADGVQTVRISVE